MNYNKREVGKKNDYNLTNHNCQTFIREIIKILRVVLHRKRNEYQCFIF